MLVGAGTALEGALEALVANTTDAVIIGDAEGMIRHWSPGAEAMFGHSAQEAIGASLEIIIPENLRARHNEGYFAVMAGGPLKPGRKTLAVPALRSDGQRISVEFSMALLRDDGGRLVGVGAILRDVTERWEEQRALRRRLAELERELAER
jgi:PAS domain S-box-containing protein